MSKTHTKEPKEITESKKRFKLCQEAERKFRVEALDDLRFRAGDQWPGSAKRRREARNRPCLTLNVLPARERQILNDRRQNRTAIDVHPVDDNADIETAKILKGMIRHIEYDSNADVAYDRADASAVRMGFGAIRITTEFDGPDSFDQVIKIKSIRNAFNVYLDPSYQEPDGSDAEFGFQFTTYTKEEYKDEFPNSELASLDNWNSVGDKDPEWLSADSVRIVEYFYKESESDKLLLLQNPAGDKRTVKKSDLPDDEIEEDEDGTYLKSSEGIRTPILNTRDMESETVYWCKHNAIELLEPKTVWPSKWIPLVPVLGDELDVDGERKLEGMIRHAKDAVRMKNAMASAQVEAIELAPKAPWIMAEGQNEGYEKMWETANTENYSTLIYKPKTIGSQVLGPPVRLVAEPAINAITEASLQFADELKSITGINDAQLGRTSNEKSGLAINARKEQGQLANFHFADNSRRAQRHVGRILIDLIPKIYDTPRVMRIIGEDGTPDMVKINQPTGKTTADGQPQIFDVRMGTYDVTVSTGPSYQTKRQESQDSMLQLINSEPTLLSIIGDLIVKNMDFPNSQEIAERMKKMLPPQLQDDKDAPPIPPQAQQKIQQYGQMIDQLTAHVNALTEQVKTKQAELESRERIAALQAETQLAINNSQLTSKEAIQGLVSEMEHVHELMGHMVEQRKIDQQGQIADQNAGLQQQQMSQDQQAQQQESAAQ
jgi:Phage P22-like portal protein